MGAIEGMEEEGAVLNGELWGRGGSAAVSIV